jgi:hypothetical protein
MNDATEVGEGLRQFHTASLSRVINGLGFGGRRLAATYFGRNLLMVSTSVSSSTGLVI